MVPLASARRVRPILCPESRKTACSRSFALPRDVVQTPSKALAGPTGRHPCFHSPLAALSAQRMSSTAAFTTAPVRITIAEIQIQVMKPITAPSEP